MAALAEVLQQNEQLRTEIQYLRKKIDWLTRRLYGKKSEQIDPGQLELLLAGLEQAVEAETTEAAASDNEPELVEKETERPRTNARSPRKLPDHLEVEEVVIEPEEVKEDPQGWRFIGEERTEELDLEPARLIKRIYIRRKYVRVDDPDRAPVMAPAPPRVIDKGIPGVRLLVYILLSKYDDHLPLNRLERIFRERFNVRISRKSMCDWVAIVAEWLKPIYNHSRKKLIGGDYLQCDETPVRYIDPDYGQNKSRQGYLWVYGRPGEDIVFDWHTGRGTEAPRRFLHGFKGVLQSDGYGAYVSLAKGNREVVLAGCWAHARRKIYEALEEEPRRAGWLIRQIQHLYGVEKRLRASGQGPCYRAAARSAESALILKRIHKALVLFERRTLKKTRLGEAVQYALNHWEGLNRYVEHGQVEIDNNSIENGIRPTAVGKRNWLFIGHPGAGDRSAVIYSILGSCRRQGIDPCEYLTDVLTRLPAMKITEVGQLAPAAWLAARGTPSSIEAAQA